MSAFLSVFLFFSSFTVKANEIVFPAFPEPVEGISSTHYLILRDNENSNYFLFMPLDPLEVKMTMADNDYRIYFRTPAMIYTWNQEERNWNIYREITTWGAFKFPIRKYEDGIIEFLYSSFDFYYSTDFMQGRLFFQKAPIKANFLTQMREVEMGATMMTVVSLIPLLVLLIVSLMGFRKAWAWLSKVLRKA